MELSDSQISCIEVLNEYAKQDNANFTRPDSLDGLVVCQHGIGIRIPAPSEAWDIYHKVKDYLLAYTEVAAFNSGYAGFRKAHQEIGIFNRIDSDCNSYLGYLDIRIQVFLQPRP